jgi:hypothetical protein
MIRVSIRYPAHRWFLPGFPQTLLLASALRTGLEMPFEGVALEVFHYQKVDSALCADVMEVANM